VFSGPGGPYDSVLLLGAFVLLLGGFAAMYVGAYQFHRGAAPMKKAFWVWGSFTGATALAFVLGYSGVGTSLANFGIAALMVMASGHYWAGRDEAPLPLIASALLYAVVAVSSALCGIVLLLDGDFVLT